MTNTNVRRNAYFSRVSGHCADDCGRFRMGVNSLVGAPGRNEFLTTNSQCEHRQAFGMKAVMDARIRLSDVYVDISYEKFCVAFRSRDFSDAS